jgi:hypothetical protein
MPTFKMKKSQPKYSFATYDHGFATRLLLFSARIQLAMVHVKPTPTIRLKTKLALGPTLRRMQVGNRRLRMDDVESFLLEYNPDGVRDNDPCDL